MKKDIWLLYDKRIKKLQTEDEGIFMCKKLNELKGRTPEDILISSEQQYNIPVDLDKIIKELGIVKMAKDFSDIENIENNGKISGLVLLIEDDIAIFYNKKDLLEQKRFTAAHEIAHCCLHGESLKNDYIEFLHKDGFENDHEKEASIFASKLLIPAEALFYIYHKMLKPTLAELSEIFQVPERIMKIRLTELNIII